MPLDTILIVSLYIACELIANTTAGKPVALPGGITVPAAVFIYALTFTLIDLINDRLGKQGARYVVCAAFLSNLLLAAYIQFAIWLPAAPFYGAGQAAFASVLGSTWRIVAASLTAYLVSTLIDVQVFAWWRERIGRYRWARVLVSNAVSTLIDSAVFITIAFLGVMPIFPLIVGQYAVKMVVTLISIPLIYAVKVHRAPAAA
ncbi:MAG: queuosine precursor transporter [Anaerolineae bacterium]|nr:queuosine precursor transporter [Anaerolineae bacterium]